MSAAVKNVSSGRLLYSASSYTWAPGATAPVQSTLDWQRAGQRCQHCAASCGGLGPCNSPGRQRRGRRSQILCCTKPVPGVMGSSGMIPLGVVSHNWCTRKPLRSAQESALGPLVQWRYIGKQSASGLFFRSALPQASDSVGGKLAKGFRAQSSSLQREVVTNGAPGLVRTKSPEVQTRSNCSGELCPVKLPTKAASQKLLGPDLGAQDRYGRLFPGLKGHSCLG